MPRRTVQEVTVQDVQKRRNPNKHYVRRLQNLSFSHLASFSVPSPAGWRKNKEGIRLQWNPEAADGWLVEWFGLGPGLGMTQLELGRARGLERGSGGVGGYSAGLGGGKGEEVGLPRGPQPNIWMMNQRAGEPSGGTSVSFTSRVFSSLGQKTAAVAVRELQQVPKHSFNRRSRASANILDQQVTISQCACQCASQSVYFSCWFQ